MIKVYYKDAKYIYENGRKWELTPKNTLAIYSENSTKVGEHKEWDSVGVGA